MEKTSPAPGAGCKHVVHTVAGGACPRCLSPLWHSTGTQLPAIWGWDALFCPVCDEWTEPACSEASCRYCADRPARPSQAPFALEVKVWRIDA